MPFFPYLFSFRGKKKTVHMTKENRATREKMPRKWVQAVFRLGGRGRGEGDTGVVATAAAAGASTRLTRTTVTTMTTTSEMTESSRAEEEETASLSKSLASRYRPEWQDSDDEDDEEEKEEKDEKERESNGGDNSSSSSSDEETARAAARLFRTVLVDSTSKTATEAAAAAANGSSVSNSASAVFVGLETHVVDVGPPLGEIAFSAAPSELRSTLRHTGLLAWPAAPALARILSDPELAASLSSSFSSASLSLLELGAGGSPLVALAAARSLSCGFRRVVSTDGSQRALRLLSSNIALNAHLIVAERVRVRMLPWGDAAAAERVVEVASASSVGAGGVSSPATTNGQRKRFDVVVGADTLYSAPALPRLMATIAATLDRSSLSSPIAVLCYQERRVRVADAEAAAAEAGLAVIDPAPAAWLHAAGRAGVGEGRLLRLLCLRPRVMDNRL